MIVKNNLKNSSHITKIIIKTSFLASKVNEQPFKILINIRKYLRALKGFYSKPQFSGLIVALVLNYIHNGLK